MGARRLSAFSLVLMLALTTTPALAQRRGGEPAVPPPVSAAISADGLRAAWFTDQDHSIVSATRADANGVWSARNRLLTARGAMHKIVFSPDGKSIAYEHSRTWQDSGKPDDTWQFICVFDLATRRMRTPDWWLTDADQRQERNCRASSSAAIAS